MVPTRSNARRPGRPLGALACLMALAASVAPHSEKASAQSAPAGKPAIPGPVAEGPAPAAAPIEGFRQARFGMTEPEVRQAIQRDFPNAAKGTSRGINLRERTTVLAIMTEDLLPDTGPARISYILGYASKRLVQVNVVWANDGRDTARDEAIVAAANTLRDHFQAQYPAPPNAVVANQPVGQNAILVFRAAQPDGRMVLLLLSGVAAAARAGRTPPPLTLQLSYIRDHEHSDIFRIGPGRF